MGPLRKTVYSHVFTLMPYPSAIVRQLPDRSFDLVEVNPAFCEHMNIEPNVTDVSRMINERKCCLLPLGSEVFMVLPLACGDFNALYQAAMLDLKTGALSYNGLSLILQNLWAETGHYWMGFMFDVDNFKALNSRVGYTRADQILRAIAHRLRSVDMVARFGGDEFIGLCDCKTQENAQQFADVIIRRLQGVLSEAYSLKPGNVQVEVTCSIGVATLGDFLPKSVDSLVEVMQNAVAEAKLNGKNQVVYA